MSRLIHRAAVVLLLACVAPVSGQQPQPPKQEPEAFPAPKVIPPEVIYELPPRIPTRWRWSLYAPNSAGIMRPRVVLSPYGSYYLRDGEPYPWTTTRPDLILPRVAN